MLHPIEVNMELMDDKGNPNIVAGVIDVHPSKINRFMVTYDGMTSMMTSDLMVIKLLVPYKEFFALYNEQHRVDNRYKEEVDEYFKNNYHFINNRRNGRKTD